MSIVCLMLPLGVIGVFIFVIIHTYPEKVSVLTIIAFSLLITMTVVGWIWAFSASYYSRWEDCDAKCCSAESNCFLKSHTNYPCCCLKRNGKYPCYNEDVDP
jgi:hypothetical protein